MKQLNLFNPRHKGYVENGGNHNIRPLQTPVGVFNNAFEAAEYYNVHRQTIGNWVRSKLKEDFYYIKESK